MRVYCFGCTEKVDRVLRLSALLKLVAKLGCQFVLLGRDSVVELFPQRPVDGESLTQLFTRFDQSLHNLVIFKVVLCIKTGEQILHLFQATVDLVDCGFGVGRRERRRLGSMKEHERAILFVRHCPLFVR